MYNLNGLIARKKPRYKVELLGLSAVATGLTLNYFNDFGQKVVSCLIAILFFVFFVTSTLGVRKLKRQLRLRKLQQNFKLPAYARGSSIIAPTMKGLMAS